MCRGDTWELCFEVLQKAPWEVEYASPLWPISSVGAVLELDHLDLCCVHGVLDEGNLPEHAVRRILDGPGHRLLQEQGNAIRHEFVEHVRGFHPWKLLGVLGLQVWQAQGVEV